jgi:hypothetical protein
MTHKREQEELLKKKAATGASVVPLFIPDREKVGYDSQKGAGGAAEEEGGHWYQRSASHP